MSDAATDGDSHHHGGDGDHALEKDGQPSAAGGHGSGSGDRHREGGNGRRFKDAKQLGKALLAILRYECAGQWLSASELLEKLHRRASERDVVDRLVSDPRRFEARRRGVANAQGWVEWEYSARQ